MMKTYRMFVGAATFKPGLYLDIEAESANEAAAQLRRLASRIMRSKVLMVFEVRDGEAALNEGQFVFRSQTESDKFRSALELGPLDSEVDNNTLK